MSIDRFVTEIIVTAIDQKRGTSERAETRNKVIIFQDSADISMAHQV